MVKPEHFYKGSIKNENYGKYDRTKEYEVRVKTWGKRPCLFLQIPSEMPRPVPGEVRESFLRLPYLRFFQLKYSTCQSARPEPITGDSFFFFPPDTLGMLQGNHLKRIGRVTNVVFFTFWGLSFTSNIAELNII